MNIDNHKEKSKIRELYLEKFLAHKPDPNEDSGIHENLKSYLLNIPDDSYVLSYFNRGQEFNIIELLKDVKNIKPDLNIYAPKIMSLKNAGARMDFYKLKFINNSSKDGMDIDYRFLEKSSFGIIEPKANAKKIFLPEFADLESMNIVVIMPGLVFDKFGNRIGFAGGYYDRYLERLNGHGTYIVPLREIQKFDENIPATEHDIKVHIHIDKNGITDLI